MGEYGPKKSSGRELPEIEFVDLLKYTAHQVEREDNQINNRLTWLLAFQGFLFLSAAAVLSQDGADNAIRLFFVATAAAVGVAVSVFARQSIEAALISLQRIIDTWERIKRDYQVTDKYVANPYGDRKEHDAKRRPPRDKGHGLALRIPITIIIGWVAVAVTALTAVVT
jgi:hypothetical protein